MFKIGTFFEEHIEKIILAIVGLVCIWLLITRVLFSPNVVVYDNDKFSPGAIDDYVYEQADLLRQKLDEPPQQLEPYKPRLGEFLALVDSAIRDIDVSLWPPQPYVSSMGAHAKGIYNLPRIGKVNDVAVEHIRAVAYLPTQEITEQNIYDKAGNEPNDLDFVTVEANIDVKGLYERFRESFAGYDVPEQWRDPCLAWPIFAAVHLQRQELNDDGSWSDWQDVPRTKIDHQKNLFKIIEDVNDLPAGGLKVRMLQLDYRQVQMDLLQPQAYQIASAKEEWFPPSLHRKFIELQSAEEREEKRKAAEEEKKEQRDRNLSLRDQRRRVPETRTQRGVGDQPYQGPGGTPGLYSEGDTRQKRRRSRSDRLTEGVPFSSRGGPTTGVRSPRGIEPYEGDINRQLLEMRREIAKKPSVNEVYNDFNKILITWRTELDKMREPLLFWHHDDTVEPKNSYRYRIRLGVLNPVAGAKKNDVILWSEFSDTTETVEIPARLYFFAKDVQEAAKTATVTVCKYVLGYWYSEDFSVRQGEVIGDVVESEPEKPELVGFGGRLPFSGAKDRVIEPEIIDYGTGAVLVDIIAVNDWSGGTNMRARHYFDMLYSSNGTDIEHMPVNRRYWAADLQDAFSKIKILPKDQKEPLRTWGSRRTGLRRASDLEYELYPEEYEQMYEGRMMEGMRRY